MAHLHLLWAVIGMILVTEASAFDHLTFTVASENALVMEVFMNDDVMTRPNASTANTDAHNAPFLLRADPNNLGGAVLWAGSGTTGAVASLPSAPTTPVARSAIRFMDPHYVCSYDKNVFYVVDAHMGVIRVRDHEDDAVRFLGDGSHTADGDPIDGSPALFMRHSTIQSCSVHPNGQFYFLQSNLLYHYNPVFDIVLSAGIVTGTSSDIVVDPVGNTLYSIQTNGNGVRLIRQFLDLLDPQVSWYVRYGGAPSGGQRFAITPGGKYIYLKANNDNNLYRFPVEDLDNLLGSQTANPGGRVNVGISMESMADASPAGKLQRIIVSVDGSRIYAGFTDTTTDAGMTMTVQNFSTPHLEDFQVIKCEETCCRNTAVSDSTCGPTVTTSTTTSNSQSVTVSPPPTASSPMTETHTPTLTQIPTSSPTLAQTVTPTPSSTHTLSPATTSTASSTLHGDSVTPPGDPPSSTRTLFSRTGTHAVSPTLVPTSTPPPPPPEPSSTATMSLAPTGCARWRDEWSCQLAVEGCFWSSGGNGPCLPLTVLLALPPRTISTVIAPSQLPRGKFVPVQVFGSSDLDGSYMVLIDAGLACTPANVFAAAARWDARQSNAAGKLDFAVDTPVDFPLGPARACLIPPTDGPMSIFTAIVVTDPLPVIRSCTLQPLVVYDNEPFRVIFSGEGLTASDGAAMVPIPEGGSPDDVDCNAVPPSAFFPIDDAAADAASASIRATINGTARVAVCYSGNAARSTGQKCAGLVIDSSGTAPWALVDSLLAASQAAFAEGVTFAQANAERCRSMVPATALGSVPPAALEQAATVLLSPRGASSSFGVPNRPYTAAETCAITIDPQFAGQEDVPVPPSAVAVTLDMWLTADDVTVLVFAKRDAAGDPREAPSFSAALHAQRHGSACPTSLPGYALWHYRRRDPADPRPELRVPLAPTAVVICSDAAGTVGKALGVSYTTAPSLCPNDCRDSSGVARGVCSAAAQACVCDAEWTAAGCNEFIGCATGANAPVHTGRGRGVVRHRVSDVVPQIPAGSQHTCGYHVVPDNSLHGGRRGALGVGLVLGERAQLSSSNCDTHRVRFLAGGPDGPEIRRWCRSDLERLRTQRTPWLVAAGVLGSPNNGTSTSDPGAAASVYIEVRGDRGDAVDIDYASVSLECPGRLNGQFFVEPADVCSGRGDCIDVAYDAPRAGLLLPDTTKACRCRRPFAAPSDTSSCETCAFGRDAATFPTCDPLPACPHNCSCHGRCTADGCVCDDGYFGRACDNRFEAVQLASALVFRSPFDNGTSGDAARAGSTDGQIVSCELRPGGCLPIPRSRGRPYPAAETTEAQCTTPPPASSGNNRRRDANGTGTTTAKGGATNAGEFGFQLNKLLVPGALGDIAVQRRIAGTPADVAGSFTLTAWVQLTGASNGWLVAKTDDARNAQGRFVLLDAAVADVRDRHRGAASLEAEPLRVYLGVFANGAAKSVDVILSRPHADDRTRTELAVRHFRLGDDATTLFDGTWRFLSLVFDAERLRGQVYVDGRSNPISSNYVQCFPFAPERVAPVLPNVDPAAPWRALAHDPRRRGSAMEAVVEYSGGGAVVVGQGLVGSLDEVRLYNEAAEQATLVDIAGPEFEGALAESRAALVAMACIGFAVIAVAAVAFVVRTVGRRRRSAAKQRRQLAAVAPSVGGKQAAAAGATPELEAIDIDAWVAARVPPRRDADEATALQTLRRAVDAVATTRGIRRNRFLSRSFLQLDGIDLEVPDEEELPRHDGDIGGEPEMQVASPRSDDCGSFDPEEKADISVTPEPPADQQALPVLIDDGHQHDNNDEAGAALAPPSSSSEGGIPKIQATSSPDEDNENGDDDEAGAALPPTSSSPSDEGGVPEIQATSSPDEDDDNDDDDGGWSSAFASGPASPLGRNRFFARSNGTRRPVFERPDAFDPATWELFVSPAAAPKGVAARRLRQWLLRSFFLDDASRGSDEFQPELETAAVQLLLQADTFVEAHHGRDDWRAHPDVARLRRELDVMAILRTCPGPSEVQHFRREFYSSVGAEADVEKNGGFEGMHAVGDVAAQCREALAACRLDAVRDKLEGQRMLAVAAATVMLGQPGATGMEVFRVAFGLALGCADPAELDEACGAELEAARATDPATANEGRRVRLRRFIAGRGGLIKRLSLLRDFWQILALLLGIMTFPRPFATSLGRAATAISMQFDSGNGVPFEDTFAACCALGMLAFGGLLVVFALEHRGSAAGPKRVEQQLRVQLARQAERLDRGLLPGLQRTARERLVWLCIMLLTTMYLPTTRVALMVLVCHEEVLCLYDCYVDPTHRMLVAISVVVVACVTVAAPALLWSATSRKQREFRAFVGEAALQPPLKSGNNGNDASAEHPDEVQHGSIRRPDGDELWAMYTLVDTSPFASVYGSYRRRWGQFAVLLLAAKAVYAVIALATVPNTTAQVVCVVLVQAAFTAASAAIAPFKFASCNALLAALQLALMLLLSLNAIFRLDPAGSEDAIGAAQLTMLSLLMAAHVPALLATDKGR